MQGWHELATRLKMWPSFGPGPVQERHSLSALMYCAPRQVSWSTSSSVIRSSRAREMAIDCIDRTVASRAASVAAAADD